MRSLTVPSQPDAPQPIPAFAATLDHLAAVAKTGSSVARNELYALLATDIAETVRTSRPARYALEYDEAISEAFLVLVAMLDDWPDTDFGGYFRADFPRRLRRALAAARHRPLPSVWSSAIDIFAVLAASDADARLIRLLAELESALSPAQRQLLRDHILRDRPLAELAARTGRSPRTLQRHWRHLVATLSRGLGPGTPHAE
jgi:hypothetical protein